MLATRPPPAPAVCGKPNVAQKMGSYAVVMAHRSCCLQSILVFATAYLFPAKGVARALLLYAGVILTIYRSMTNPIFIAPTMSRHLAHPDFAEPSTCSASLLVLILLQQL
ncbi:hypothetical protein EDB19DRAFT_178037 [Suillus lakei]|nr:hypothetical protein EDB19DRAFT_178037 [Suillus lakei]